jgi:hypothetical protein
MIAHVSLPADDCAHVARVLAEMICGVAVRFPPGGPDAWNCWSAENDFQIVVTPRGSVFSPGSTEQVPLKQRSEERRAESHFAMAVPRSAAEILELAANAGWPASVCGRGNFFDAVEVWVENAYLVEVLDPTQLADYRRNMTVENWRRALAI